MIVRLIKKNFATEVFHGVERVIGSDLQTLEVKIDLNGVVVWKTFIRGVAFDSFTVVKD